MDNESEGVVEASLRLRSGQAVMENLPNGYLPERQMAGPKICNWLIALA
jgi:hypothetical protein